MSCGFGAIISLPCSILGWVFGRKGERAIANGETTQGEGPAKAGKILGIVGTILAVLGIVTVVVLILVGVFAESSTDDNDTSEPYFDTIRLAGALAGALGRLVG